MQAQGGDRGMALRIRWSLLSSGPDFEDFGGELVARQNPSGTHQAPHRITPPSRCTRAARINIGIGRIPFLPTSPRV